MAVRELDALEIAESFHQEYKDWLKQNGVVTSFKYALRFVRMTAPNWRNNWGLIKTDTIAEELHDSFLK